jgi:glycosyltransferase involved in cell wall biosynthesis
MTLRSAAVIPAFNEGNTIAAVVEGVRGFVDRVIVVDDGSRDGTAGGRSAAART